MDLRTSHTISLLQAQGQQPPRLVIPDFDGTLFTLDMRIIYEIMHQNRHLSRLLRQKRIPLVINTARPDWSPEEKRQARVLNIHADTIIAGAGTKIYHKTTEGDWVIDTAWETIISKSSWSNHTELFLDDVIKNWKAKHNVLLRKAEGNSFLLRYTVHNAASSRLPAIAASLQKQVKNGIDVIYTESLYSNKFGFRTGSILIIPEIAGKSNAVKYLLDAYSGIIKKPLQAFCFGDGAIDLNSFLRIPSTKDYILQQFLINPTTLAKSVFTTQSFSHKPILVPRRGVDVMIEKLS